MSTEKNPPASSAKKASGNGTKKKAVTPSAAAATADADHGKTPSTRAEQDAVRTALEEELGAGGIKPDQSGLDNLLDEPEGSKTEHDDDEDDSELKDERDVLLVHKKKCTACGHLVDYATKFYDCTSDKNDLCPAGGAVIMVGVNFDKAARAIASNMTKGNVEALQSNLDRLHEHNPTVVRRVMELAREFMIEGYTGDDTQDA